MQLVNRINEIISNYKELGLESNNLTDLIGLRQELSTLSFELGREVANYKVSFDKSYARRKIAFYKKKNEYISDGVTKAETLAEVEIADLREAEKTNEGLYSGGRIILSQVNEVLKSMQQDISLLKMELNN